MAENKDQGGTVPQPKNGVSPTVFWIVAVVLAIGVGAVYFVLEKKLDENSKSLSDLLKSSSDKQTKDLAAQGETINKAIAEGVTKQEAANKAVQELITKNQAELAASVAAVKKDLTASTEKTNNNIVEVATKLTTTTDNVGKIDGRVVYLEKDMKEMKDKLNGLDSQIGEIKTGSAALKAEQQKLLSEIKTIGGRTDVTQGELNMLVQRTRDFELKVLLEHAAQASKVAEKHDYEKVFEMMNSFKPAPKK